MTILPKKKASQAKNSDSVENVENGNVVVGSHQIQSSTENRDRHYAGGRTRDEKRPSQANAYEEYEGLDGPGGAPGVPNVNPNNSTQHKRRHRASPHRNCRKHRNPNTNPTAVGISLSSAPSTSSSANLASLSTGNNSPNAEPSSTAETLDENVQDISRCNSGDEYSQQSHMRTEEEWTERERIFEKKLRKKGLIIKKMGEDGACLFRSVADQIYGDQEMHTVVRKHCMDYMAKNVDYFSQYVTEDFETYLQRKRLDHVHGNHVEMQAICEIYNRSIQVYHYTTDPINTFHGIHSTDNEPIRISYHKSIHYNSIVDPYKATVGVGLGLPGFMPGLAEKNLMHDAVRQSEEFHIEQTMLEDKMKATDWEATNEAIEEQVARESYLQWLRDNERRNRKATSRSATATCSSSANTGGASPDIRSPTGSLSPHARPSASPGNGLVGGESSSYDMGASGHSSALEDWPSLNTEASKFLPGGSNGAEVPHAVAMPPTSCDGLHSDFRLLETASFMNQLPPDVFGLTEWEDADILAQVLAASQQEYLDTLKRATVATAGIDTASPSGNPSTSFELDSASGSTLTGELPRPFES